MKITSWLFISLFVCLPVQAAVTNEAVKNETVTTESVPANSEEKTSEQRGKELHDPECISSCHTPKSYTSENRKVKDLANLNSFVQMCATNLDKSWFEEDVADVANYLNKDYYKFSVK